jgi:hypothetical protein
MLIPAGGATEAVEPMRMIEPPLDMRGTADWTANSTPFRFADHRVELLLRDLREGRVSIDDGVGHDHVEAPRPRLHVLEQRVHRRGAPRVRPNARGRLPDRRDRLVESPLIASRHDDGGALFREFPRDREADALRTARDNRNLSIE